MGREREKGGGGKRGRKKGRKIGRKRGRKGMEIRKKEKRSGWNGKPWRKYYGKIDNGKLKWELLNKEVR